MTGPHHRPSPARSLSAVKRARGKSVRRFRSCCWVVVPSEAGSGVRGGCQRSGAGRRRADPARLASALCTRRNGRPADETPPARRPGLLRAVLCRALMHTNMAALPVHATRVVRGPLSVARIREAPSSVWCGAIRGPRRDPHLSARKMQRARPGGPLAPTDRDWCTGVGEGAGRLQYATIAPSTAKRTSSTVERRCRPLRTSQGLRKPEPCLRA